MAAQILPKDSVILLEQIRTIDKQRLKEKLCRLDDHFYPDTTGAYSWWSYRFNARKNNAGWRIDYYVVSVPVLQRPVRRGMPEMRPPIPCGSSALRSPAGNWSKGFLDYFKAADADIFSIQETKLQEGQIALETEGWHQYWKKNILK